MSNKTQLQANNTQLASLIQTLQGKATGGGGASVETCTVTVNAVGGYVTTYLFTTYENGQWGAACNWFMDDTTVTIENVSCNTAFCIATNLAGASARITGDVERQGASGQYLFYFLKSNPGSTVTLEIYSDA